MRKQRSGPPNSPPPIAESKESSSQAFTFVYRGENPYLNELVAQVSALGHNVTVYKIPVETPQEVLNDPQKLKSLIGNLDGKIVTDRTVYKSVRSLAGAEVLNAYKLLNWEIKSVEDVIDKISPIVEEIRSKGKTPVVLRQWLGDHADPMLGSLRVLEKELENSPELIALEKKSYYATERSHPRAYIKAANFYAAILSDRLGVPVIRGEHFKKDSDGIKDADILEALGKIGVNADDAVILVDHHVYSMRKAEVAATHFDQVQIVPICDCCIGFNESSSKEGLSDFNIFPLSYKAEVAFDARKLVDPKVEEAVPVASVSAEPRAVIQEEMPDAVQKTPAKQKELTPAQFEKLPFGEQVELVTQKTLARFEKPKGAPSWAVPSVDQKMVRDDIGIAAFVVVAYGKYDPEKGPEMIYSVYTYKKGDKEPTHAYVDIGYGNERNARLYIQALEANQITLRQHEDNEILIKPVY